MVEVLLTNYYLLEWESCKIFNYYLLHYDYPILCRLIVGGALDYLYYYWYSRPLGLLLLFMQLPSQDYDYQSRANIIIFQLTISQAKIIIEQTIIVVPEDYKIIFDLLVLKISTQLLAAAT